MQDDAGVISEQTALILKKLRLLVAHTEAAMILNAVSYLAASSLNFSNPQGIGPPFTMRYDRISYLFFVPVGLLKEGKVGR